MGGRQRKSGAVRQREGGADSSGRRTAARVARRWGTRRGRRAARPQEAAARQRAGLALPPARGTGPLLATPSGSGMTESCDAQRRERATLDR